MVTESSSCGARGSGRSEGQAQVKVKVHAREGCRSGRGACRAGSGGLGLVSVRLVEVEGLLVSHARIGRKSADLRHIDPALLQHRGQLLHVHVAVAVRVDRVEDCLEPRGLEAGASGQTGGVIHTSAWRAGNGFFREGAGSMHARGVTEGAGSVHARGVKRS